MKAQFIQQRMSFFAEPAMNREKITISQSGRVNAGLPDAASCFPAIEPYLGTMPARKRRRLSSLIRSTLPPFLRSDAKRVRVVCLRGVIGRVSPVSSGGLSLEAVAEQLDTAFGDERAAAVALIVNSPGGSPVQSHLIYRRIRDLAAEWEKPVFAFVEDVAASGGYMIACAADFIFADPSSIVGSIGVVSGGFGFVDAIAKLGIERRVHTAGESKAMLDPFLPERPEEVERLRELQRQVHAHFIALVREGRGDRLKDAENLFTGAFWTGARGAELGLVDGLADLRGEMRRRFGEKVKLVPVRGRGRLSLGRLFGTAIGGVPAAVADTAIERGLWSRYGL